MDTTGAWTPSAQYGNIRRHKMSSSHCRIFRHGFIRQWCNKIIRYRLIVRVVPVDFSSFNFPLGSYCGSIPQLQFEFLQFVRIASADFFHTHITRFDSANGSIQFSNIFNTFLHYIYSFVTTQINNCGAQVEIPKMKGKLNTHSNKLHKTNILSFLFNNQKTEVLRRLKSWKRQL